MEFVPDDPAGDVLDFSCGEHTGVVLMYRLPEQALDQRGGGDVLGGGPLPQLRVQFPVDAQVQWHVQATGLLCDLSPGRVGFVLCDLGEDRFVPGTASGPGLISGVSHQGASYDAKRASADEVLPTLADGKEVPGASIVGVVVVSDERFGP